MADGYCPFCLTKKSGPFCPKCGLPEESYKGAVRDLPPGSVLERRYYVGRKLGEGGFGITYAGIDMVLERRIAIKEYFPSGMAGRYAAESLEITAYTGGEADYNKGKANFVREARIMARMNKQPEIADCLDFFEINNTAYIIMEYVDGPTLKSRVQNSGPFEPQQFFELIKPVMGALSNMHKAGIIHRDISPDNLIIEKNRLRLIDFGCAREDITTELTMTLMLKHGFSPVEQYQRKGQGPWTDVYALGATMYYCITGRVAPQAVDRLIEDEIIPPSKLADITPRQEAAILKAMAVRVNDRFKSAEEFSNALYAAEYIQEQPPVYVAGQPPVYVPEEPSASMSKQAKAEDKSKEADEHIYFVKIEKIFEEAKADAEKIITKYSKISRDQAKESIEAFFKGHNLRIMLEKKEEAALMVSELKAKGIWAEIEEAGREDIPAEQKEAQAGEAKAKKNSTRKMDIFKIIGLAAIAVVAAAVISLPFIFKPWQTVKNITAQDAETTQEADSVQDEGTTGEVSWKYDGSTKTLTISGTGRMEDYSNISESPWIDYDIDTIVIEKGLTYIGVYAFYSLDANEIVLSESLKEIGDNAFRMTDLISVNIPAGVESIGTAAFSFCIYLEEFTVEEDNENFAAYEGVLFSADMTTLVCYPAGKDDKQYIIPDGVTVIEGYAFNSSYNLSVVSLPEGVVEIGEYAFSYCDSILYVVLPESIEVIGDYAFEGCDRLTAVYYRGTEAQWDLLIANGYVDESLSDVTVYYEYEE